MQGQAINPAADRAAEVAELLEQRLGIRGAGLERKLARAGRLLPRRVRRAATELIEARRLAEHPRLARRVDLAAVEAAYRACAGWLRGIDRSERRKDRVLGFLAVNAFNLILVAAAFIAYLVWSGAL